MKTNWNKPTGPKVQPRFPSLRPTGPREAAPTAPTETVDLGSTIKAESKKLPELSKKSLITRKQMGFSSAFAGAAGLVGASSIVAAGALSIAPLGMGALLGGVVGAAAGMALSDPALMKKFVGMQKQEAAGRTRNADGRFRTKSGNTRIDTLRETYGEGFAAGLPGNMPLQVMRAATGKSLTQMVKNPEHLEKAKDKLADWKAPELAPGGRTRNADGRIRQKRGDTKLDTLRKTYGMDFADQLPGNMTLAVLRGVTGKSLSQLVDTGLSPKT